MDKAIIEKIYTTAMTMVITFLAGLLLKKTWTAISGAEPPDPEDPDVPVAKAVGWFLASGVGVGLAQLLVTRNVHRRVRQIGRKPSDNL